MKGMPCLTNGFSVLEECTVGVTRDMLCSSISLNQTETNLAMLRLVPTPLVLENSDPPGAYVYSVDTRRCTRILIKTHSVDTGHPSVVDSLLDSEATGMFIDVEYVRTQKLQAHPLPCAIPVYNIDGTSNEAASIKEEVDLICTFGNRSKYATFFITSLGGMGIILGYTWLIKHNPEIDWQTGEVKMSHCPDSCGNRPASAQLLKEVTPKSKTDLAQSPTQRERTFVLLWKMKAENMSMQPILYHSNLLKGLWRLVQLNPLKT